MPLYEYTCESCGNVAEEFRTIEHRNDPLRCATCEGRMTLQFVAPSAIRTDTQFQRGIHSNDGMKNDKDRRRAKALAAKMGVNIEGKRYDGRLARFPCDPLAFYGDRSEARAAAVRAGVGSADLGVKAPLDDQTGRPYRVADDIVERQAATKVVTEHGGSVPRPKWEKIKQEVREQITPKPEPAPKCLQ